MELQFNSSDFILISLLEKEHNIKYGKILADFLNSAQKEAYYDLLNQGDIDISRKYVAIVSFNVVRYGDTYLEAIDIALRNFDEGMVCFYIGIIV